MVEEEINAGNEPDTTSEIIEVEGENVTIFSKEVDGKKEVTKIGFPDSKKDDVDWQKKAKDTINLTSLKYKANLENKKQLAELDKKQKDLQETKKLLSEMGGTSSTDLKFDLRAGLLKELNLDSVADLANVDQDDIDAATQKVTKAYADEVERSTKNVAISKVLLDRITEENEPDQIRSFISFVKNLGVKPTPQVYDTWKAQNRTKKTTTKEEVPFSTLAGMQLEHVPFVPIGESHETLTGEAKIEKENAEIMLGGLRHIN